jgi:hypothetical protein
MAILPSIDNNTRKRELTDKQQAFLTHLVETQGDAKEAAPKAAFKLVEIMESNRPIIQANNKLAAAQTLLDRVGVGKIDRVDVNHNVNSGGIFLMPDKKPLDLEEADYEDISD